MVVFDDLSCDVRSKRSLQVDETIDISTKEQVSAIIRLDKKGDIVERFLKFIMSVLTELHLL